MVVQTMWHLNERGFYQLLLIEWIIFIDSKNRKIAILMIEFMAKFSESLIEWKFFIIVGCSHL